MVQVLSQWIISAEDNEKRDKALRRVFSRDAELRQKTAARTPSNKNFSEEMVLPHSASVGGAGWRAVSGASWPGHADRDSSGRGESFSSSYRNTPCSSGNVSSDS